MRFEDAVKKSIKAFIAGKMPQELSGQADTEIMFTPEYFDKMESDLDLSPSEEESEDESA